MADKSAATYHPHANYTEWARAGDGCTCFVNPNPFTYYGAVEPGDALDADPECPKHFPHDTLEEAREAEFVRQYLGVWVREQDNDKDRK
jgi:hypothetical protein